MRHTQEMASDWEDAKYSYVALSRIDPEVSFSARCVGQVHREKGFLTVPILTKDKIVHQRVLKRDKEAYNIYKELQWGEILA